jgi:peptidoglycan hydrolase CwlO-like protein
MRNKFVKTWIIYCCLFLSISNISLSYEEPTLEETRELLQKGLIIYEIDAEVKRLSEKEKQISLEIVKKEEEVAVQHALVEKTKERAGKILRSYYMGERDSLLMQLFSSDNLSDALTVIEFVNMIFKSDQRTLDNYLTSYLDSKKLHAQLIESQTNLRDIKQQFLLQRETLVRIQGELDSALENHPETDRLTNLIEELTLEWQNKGRPIFRSYFKALAEAMQKLPEIQTKHKNVLSFKGTNIQFQLTDTQLNEFLIEKNKLFENFAFRFKDESIEAQGEQDGLKATIKGHFNLEKASESVIRFHLDELIYNGFSLPDSTIKALEEEYDLGFYPEKTSFLGFKLEATELYTESGKLKVILKFK